MIDWEQTLINNFSSYSNEEFEYIETTDINQAKNLYFKKYIYNQAFI